MSGRGNPELIDERSATPVGWVEGNLKNIWD